MVGFGLLMLVIGTSTKDTYSMKNAEKLASKIVPGDVLIVRGRELHDDLAGLDFSIKVEGVELAADGLIDVYTTDADGHPDKIWWKPDETVKFHHPAE